MDFNAPTLGGAVKAVLLFHLKKGKYKILKDTKNMKEIKQEQKKKNVIM